MINNPKLIIEFYLNIFIVVPAEYNKPAKLPLNPTRIFMQSSWHSASMSVIEKKTIHIDKIRRLTKRYTLNELEICFIVNPIRKQPCVVKCYGNDKYLAMGKKQ